MPTPRAITVISRALLAMACLALTLWALAPWPELRSLAQTSGRISYAGGFYAASLIGALALPRLRRNDIALLGLGLASLLETVRAITGVDAGLANLAAAAGGIFAAWAPAAIDPLRRRSRRHPFLSFRDIRELEDERERLAA